MLEIKDFLQKVEDGKQKEKKQMKEDIEFLREKGILTPEEEDVLNNNSNLSKKDLVDFVLSKMVTEEEKRNMMGVLLAHSELSLKEAFRFLSSEGDWVLLKKPGRDIHQSLSLFREEIEKMVREVIFFKGQLEGLDEVMKVKQACFEEEKG